MGLLNIVIQIDASEHHSDGEQYVIRNIDGAGDSHTTIEPYADLSAGEKTEYDELKAVYDAYISPDTAICIIMQIDSAENGNTEERVVIVYDDGGTITRVIKTYAELTSGEKTKYDAFKTQATGKAPA